MFIAFLENRSFEVDIDCWSHFGANLAPFWDQKSIKIQEEIDSKMHPKNKRFLDRFVLHVGAILVPKSCQLGSQDLYLGPQEAPKKRVPGNIFRYFFENHSPDGLGPILD